MARRKIDTVGNAGIKPTHDYYLVHRRYSGCKLAREGVAIYVKRQYIEVRVARILIHNAEARDAAGNVELVIL